MYCKGAGQPCSHTLKERGNPMSIERETHNYLASHEHQQESVEELVCDMDEFQEWWDEELENDGDDFVSSYDGLIDAIGEELGIVNMFDIISEGELTDPMPIVRLWFKSAGDPLDIHYIAEQWFNEVQRRVEG